MKPRYSLRSALPTSIITVACSIFAVQLSTGASQIWDGDTDANWTTAANWMGNAVPGINPTSNATNTADVATFNAAINGTTLAGSAANPVINDGTAGNVSSNRMIGRIVFDSAAGAYFIGAAGSTTTLQVGNNLTNVEVTSSVLNPQTINAPLALHLPSSTNGFGAIRNDSATESATLTLAGGILNSPNSSRGSRWTIGGANTGNNTISGVITLSNSGGQTSTLTKADPGLWILSGANTIGGGVIVNDGTLIAQNAGAFGTAGLTINNAALVRIDGGITLGNNNVTMDASSELRSNGSNSVNKVTAAAAAVAPILSTVSSGDVFTIGSAANSVTGGTATTVLTVSGPGTISLPTANNYAGTWAVDSGTLNLGSSTALGTLGSVNVASGAKMQTMGNLVSLTVLTGSGAVSNGMDGASTLTANISASNTFDGQLQDGVAGTLALTKTGAGTLNLSGASNYTDVTTISTGVLNLTGSLGNTAVSGASGATLSGTGAIAGSVTLGSGVHVAPGDGGNAALGTITTGALSLDADSQLDFGITNTTTLDKITVSTGGGLTINGGQLNINGGVGEFTAIGTYPLIAYTGAIGGSGVSSLTVNGLNKSVTRTYTFTAAGGFVNLVVANSGFSPTYWNVNADGNWGTSASWTPATVPNATGAFAGFGGGGTAITAPRTVTVNGSFTVGTLSFNNSAQAFTLAAGTGANLTLNNGASGALVTDTAGNHTINSPLTLTANGVTFTVVNDAHTLTVGGAIGGSGNSLVKGGAGTLVLNGTNTYVGGTTINGGTLAINTANSMGDAANLTIINAGTLRTTADILSVRTLQIGDLASTISVANGTTYTLNGILEDGANVGVLNKTDTGTLVLNSSNSYTGGTVINAGTLQVNNAASLGGSAGSVTLHSATLQATATFVGTRNVILGSVASTILVDATQTYTIDGQITGTGTLNKTGAGTLALGSNINNFSGGTVISEGILAINEGSFLGAGTVTFQGGTLQNAYSAGNTYGMANPIDIPSGQVGTINMGNRMNISGAVSGSGTLNVNAQTTADRNDLTGSWNTFAGQLNFAGSSNIRLLTQGGVFNGFNAASVTMDGSVSFAGVNFSGGATTHFGMLTSTSPTTALRASQLGGQNTWSIGALNLSGTFAGQIQGGTVIKVGTGILTLSGINTYAGNTNITDGEIVLHEDGGLRFVIGANGVSNKVTGAGTATLNGDFTFDLAGADLTNGNSWTIVDATIPTFGSTFSVVDFEDNNADNIWTKVDGGNTWTFDEATGVLSLVSAPASQYTAWAISQSLSAGVNDGPSQDPDFDGIANTLEFVLGGNPLASDPAKLPVLTTDATNFIFTFNRADASETEIGLVFQYGSTLTGWTDVPIGAISSSTPPVTVNVTENTDPAPDTVQVLVPKTSAVGGKLFGHLKAVK
jgi:autotransporter-associated beta strand protein